MGANRGLGVLVAGRADRKMAMWARPKTSVLRAVASALLASLLLIYTGHARQQEDLNEELLPVQSAGYSPIELDVGQPIFVTSGDVDGDGHIDLVLLSVSISEQGNAPQTRVQIVKVDWTTGVAHTQLLHTVAGLAPYAAIVDLDGDGYTDVVVFDSQIGAFVVFRGDGRGSFEKDLIMLDRQGFVGNFAVADVDVDGYVDLVFADHLLGYVQILWGGDRLGLARGSTYAFPARHYPASVVTGDFTGDGHLEVAVLGLRAEEIGWVYFVALFSLNEDRQLSLLSTTEVGNPDPTYFGVPLAAGDYDRDGHLDLLTARSEHGYVLLGHGDGTFVVEEVYWLLDEKNVSQMSLVDLDGDGCLNDIIIGLTTARVWVMTGCYGGERVGWVLPVIGLPVSAATADVDRDGTLDLIVASNSLLGSTYLEVFLGDQGGQR